LGFALAVAAVPAKHFRPEIPEQIGELLEVQFLSTGVEGRLFANRGQTPVITAFKSKPTKTYQSQRQQIPYK
jgi:hypothetical protein